MEHEVTSGTPTYQPVKRALRMPELLRKVPYKSRITIWRKVHAGQFPAPIQLGPNAIAWLESDVDAWLGSRPRVAHAPASDTANAAA